MCGALHHHELPFAAHFTERFVVEIEYDQVGATHDQQGRAAYSYQICVGEVWSAAARDNPAIGQAPEAAALIAAAAPVLAPK